MTDNVREVFNEIAPGWYNFRHNTIFRRELESLAAEWQKGRLLNLGCGHGPDFLPFKHTFELHGLDSSIEMVKLAKQYAVKNWFTACLVNADICCLPYTDESFDYAIAVATYHHLKPAQQTAAFLELKRVLKPGGRAFITVWNHYQPKFWFRGHDVMVPWHIKDKILYRYYHLFSYGELVKLAKNTGFEILRVFPESRYRFPVKYFSRNICLLVRKI